MNNYLTTLLTTSLIFGCTLNTKTMETLPEEKLHELLRKFINHTSEVEEQFGCTIEREGHKECSRMLSADLAPLNGRLLCFRDRDFCLLANLSSKKALEISGLKALAYARLLAEQKTYLSDLSQEELERTKSGDENCKKLWISLSRIKVRKKYFVGKAESRTGLLLFE